MVGLRKKDKGGAKSSRKEKRSEAEVYADEYYAADEAQAIDLASLKKSKRYMFLGIGMLVLSILLVAGFVFLSGTTVRGKQEACWKYQQKVEEAAKQYMVTNGFSSLPAYVEDLKIYEQIKEDCPAGGSYTWNPVTGTYSCSEHGHYPEGYNSAQSLTLGVSKTEDTANANKSK